MDTVIEKIGDWLKEVIISFIMNQLTGLFDSINMQVGSVAEQVGKTPQDLICSPYGRQRIRKVFYRGSCHVQEK